MKTISDKSCRDIRNTHCKFNNVFFENRAVYEIMWNTFVCLLYNGYRVFPGGKVLPRRDADLSPPLLVLRSKIE